MFCFVPFLELQISDVRLEVDCGIGKTLHITSKTSTAYQTYSFDNLCTLEGLGLSRFHMRLLLNLEIGISKSK